MRRFFIETFEDLADTMYKMASERKTSCAVLDFDDAEKLIRELLMFDRIQIKCIDFCSDDNEFYVSVTSDFELYVEQVKIDDQYVTDESDCIFLGGNVNSKILNYLIADEYYEIAIEEEPENIIRCTGDCEYCDYCDTLEEGDTDDESDDIHAHDNVISVKFQFDTEDVSIEEVEFIADAIQTILGIFHDDND